MSEDLTEVIQIRIDPEKKKMAKSDAYWHEMSVGEYIRMLLDLGHAIREREEGQK